MKHFLLSFFLLFILSAVNAQTDFAGSFKSKEPKVRIYPNPTTNSIGLNKTDDIAYIRLLNLIGQEVRVFYVKEGQCYNVSDLENGMYLVQVINNDNKILVTQRLRKM